MVEVQLTMAEIVMAANIGVMRQVNNIKGGHKNLYGGHENQNWQYHIEGALGECAFAKFTDLFWSMGAKGEADVGPYQVRTTDKHTNRLILHKKDPDDAWFYLVTGLNGSYQIHGRIKGAAGKQDKFWTDPTGRDRWAYFVPQSELYEVV